MRTDSRIQRDVLDELKWDAHVKETDVGVEVHSGTVTLTGTVKSWMERLAAQDAAHRVPDVLDVANDIVVRPLDSFARTDTDIAHAVRHALEWDVVVPHEKIKSTVTNGLVTLEGEVDYPSESDGAARAVRNLVGVREVVNRIVVVHHDVHASTRAVRESIDRALARHAQHTARHLEVEVVDDVAVLTGQVPSWAELMAAEGAARGTPGVRKIDSRVRIQS